MFIPILSYNIQIWGPAKPSNIHPIKDFQNVSLNVITGIDPMLVISSKSPPWLHHCRMLFRGKTYLDHHRRFDPKVGAICLLRNTRREMSQMINDHRQLDHFSKPCALILYQQRLKTISTSAKQMIPIFSMISGRHKGILGFIFELHT
ncbi:putative RNA-directed DNA polymerase [Aphis craccivora]|uniref:Putative RNA-directed DNA polymerase n=1 Tax=Aphis craccivora TaxID=307492 RepID=A0A6G0ZG85_APHCR|nr:putative RNA-directed DNA polymerase [Aphis craccivora]